MKDLIESLQIFLKYFPDVGSPAHCEHDIFMLAVANDKDAITDPHDRERLDELGWFFSSEYECWCSFRFGSC